MKDFYIKIVDNKRIVNNKRHCLITHAKYVQSRCRNATAKSISALEELRRSRTELKNTTRQLNAESQDRLTFEGRYTVEYNEAAAARISVGTAQQEVQAARALGRLRSRVKIPPSPSWHCSTGRASKRAARTTPRAKSYKWSATRAHVNSLINVATQCSPCPFGRTYSPEGVWG